MIICFDNYIFSILNPNQSKCNSTLLNSAQIPLKPGLKSTTLKILYWRESFTYLKMFYYFFMNFNLLLRSMLKLLSWTAYFPSSLDFLFDDAFSRAQFLFDDFLHVAWKVQIANYMVMNQQQLVLNDAFVLII